MGWVIVRSMWLGAKDGLRFRFVLGCVFLFVLDEECSHKLNRIRRSAKLRENV